MRLRRPLRAGRLRQTGPAGTGVAGLVRGGCLTDRTAPVPAAPDRCAVALPRGERDRCAVPVAVLAPHPAGRSGRAGPARRARPRPAMGRADTAPVGAGGPRRPVPAGPGAMPARAVVCPVPRRPRARPTAEGWRARSPPRRARAARPALTAPCERGRCPRSRRRGERPPAVLVPDFARPARSPAASRPSPRVLGGYGTPWDGWDGGGAGHDHGGGSGGRGSGRGHAEGAARPPGRAAPGLSQAVGPVRAVRPSAS